MRSTSRKRSIVIAKKILLPTNRAFLRLEIAFFWFLLLDFGETAAVRVFLLNENFLEPVFYTFNSQNNLKSLVEIDMLINNYSFIALFQCFGCRRERHKHKPLKHVGYVLKSDLETFFNHLQPKTIRVEA